MFKKNKVHEPANQDIIEGIVIQKYEKLPGHGVYAIRTQIVPGVVIDDNIIDQLAAKYMKDVDKYLKRFSTTTKADLIRIWSARLKQVCEDLKTICKQPAETDVAQKEKTKKIARYLEKIIADGKSIQKAIEFLSQRDITAQKFDSGLQKTK